MTATLNNLYTKARIHLTVILLSLLSSLSEAKERIQNRFDETSGLTVSTVYALTQDDYGFLWIGTTGGLVRFDGQEMRPWAKDSFSRVINLLLAGPGGEVLILDEDEILHQVSGDYVRPLAGPDGKPFDKVATIAFSSDRTRLWVAAANRLYCRDADNRWELVATDSLAIGQIR